MKLSKEQKEAKKEYLNQLGQDLRYSINKFDNQILYISSGALGLSLAFVQNIVPLDKIKFECLFYTSLWFFVFTILLGLITHIISANIITREFKRINNDDFNSKEDLLIPILNWVLLSLLVIGIFLLVLFVQLNFMFYGE